LLAIELNFAAETVIDISCVIVGIEVTVAAMVFGYVMRDECEPDNPPIFQPDDSPFHLIIVMVANPPATRVLAQSCCQRRDLGGRHGVGRVCQSTSVCTSRPEYERQNGKATPNRQRTKTNRDQFAPFHTIPRFFRFRLLLLRNPKSEFRNQYAMCCR
jgi:hypothetical protein